MPEYGLRQWVGPASVEEDDLFALGLSIWQLWKGDVPFRDVYMDDIYQMVSFEMRKAGFKFHVTVGNRLHERIDHQYYH
jgi:hypothetical protein